MEETISRITRMEQCFDALCVAAAENPERLRKDSELMKELRELTEYYENGQWLRDYELDERGQLPADLKRGVLAQDAVYDLLDSLSPENNEEEKI